MALQCGARRVAHMMREISYIIRSYEGHITSNIMDTMEIYSKKIRDPSTDPSLYY